VWRATDVGDVLHRVGGGIDETDRVRPDRHGDKRPVIGRKAKPVNEQLAAIQRTHVAGLRVAEADRPDQRVARGVDDRNRVRVLFAEIDAVARADRFVWRRCCFGRLAGVGRPHDGGKQRNC
jgi:hypothetical protein